MKLRLAFAVGVVAFLALLGGCANWSGQGPASGSVSLSVGIEKPRADALTNSRQLVVKATATGGRIDRVEVEYQGPQSGKVSLSPQTGSWLGDLPGVLPSGSYTLTAKAYSGSQVKDSVPVKFTLDVDPPTVQFLGPSLSVLGSGSVEVRVRATDALSGVLGVQLYAGTRLLGDMTPTPSGEYVFSLDASSLASGSVSLRAVAKDGAGNQGETTLAITVDKTPPTVTWLEPADGAVVSGTVPLRVEATDNVGVAKVEFFAGSTKIGEATSAPYEISWNTTAYPDGPVTLKARAEDRAGNVAEAAI
ncbi:Ig-like domain-containing protein, partial [Thermus caliditerrae]|uniref:Ig-like domain-containing protein n=1 Tax=Thermus caliditerrae TaxID=1330700 RepID=UPI001F43FF5B